jgi:GNAT superfamily N-acetyltransferase
MLEAINNVDQKSGKSFVVQNACNADELVLVHQSAFPGFYLTQMGPSFLRVYYSSVLAFKDSIALVAQVDGKTIGFVVGFSDPEAFYQYFRAKRLRLVPIILWAIVRNPSLLARTLRNSRRIARGSIPLGTTELSSIAVSPTVRGAGSVLIPAFLERAVALKSDRVLLTTDAIGNEHVNNFYVKHGFLLQRTFDDGGRLMNEYVLKIKE